MEWSGGADTKISVSCPSSTKDRKLGFYFLKIMDMHRDTLKNIYELSAKKKDWVYTLRRNTFYVVCNNSLVSYCEYDWPNWWIYQVAYGIASKVWEVENEIEIRKKLKEWLELYKL